MNVWFITVPWLTGVLFSVIAHTDYSPFDVLARDLQHMTDLYSFADYFPLCYVVIKREWQN